MNPKPLCLIALQLLLIHAAPKEKRPDADCKSNTNVGQQTSINIALKAAQEAKAAADAQQREGLQAAHRAKEQLAEKAMEASKAAEAALAGKQELVEQLDNEIQEAKTLVQDEQANLQELQGTEKGSCKKSQANAQQLSEKKQLVDATYAKIGKLKKRLEVAKTELNSTREAAKKASAAAHQARENVMIDKRKIYRKNAEI